jgi:hypothetical protein
VAVGGDEWDYVTGVAGDGGGGAYFTGKSTSKTRLTVGAVEFAAGALGGGTEAVGPAGICRHCFWHNREIRNSRHLPARLWETSRHNWA